MLIAIEINAGGVVAGCILLGLAGAMYLFGRGKDY